MRIEKEILATVMSCLDEEKPEVETCKVKPSQTETAQDSGELPSLSKRALKKLKKRQEWLDSKPERRKKEKEKRKLKMAARKLEQDYEETRSASRKSLKDVKMSSSSCRVCVVFDMQFGDLMTERDLGKCLKQVTRCYRY